MTDVEGAEDPPPLILSLHDLSDRVGAELLALLLRSVRRARRLNRAEDPAQLVVRQGTVDEPGELTTVDVRAPVAACALRDGDE